VSSELPSSSISTYKHRGALPGTPGSASPQPEPNATELPSCAPISARAAQRRRRRRWWRGEEGARRPCPETQVLRHVLWHVTSRSSAASCAASFTCSSFICHLRAGGGGGGGLASGSPRAAATSLQNDRWPKTLRPCAAGLQGGGYSARRSRPLAWRPLISSRALFWTLPMR